MRYRLGLDLGATSIGWSIMESDSRKVVDAGIRIFDDGRNDKDKAALCVIRREKRGLRRLNKRRKMRLNTLINHLVEMELLPENTIERKALKDLNPYKNSISNDPEEMKTIKESRRMPIYALRANALDKQLNPYELGRIFLQLAQRRGFRSNRKGDEENKNSLAKANEELISQMERYEARTYGEYLYKRHLKNPLESMRIKNAFDEKDKLKGDVVFPFRYDYENEFDAIWDKQREFYPDILNDENKQTVKRIIFLQRPLKEQEIGYCILEPEEKRIPKAHPLFQEFRILQDVNHIRILNFETGEETVLSDEQRNALATILNSKDKKVKVKDLKKKAEFKNVQFSNKDDEDSLPINTTERAIRMRRSSELQDFWEKLGDESREEVISVLARPGDHIESYKNAKTADDQDNEIMEYLKDRYAVNEEVAEELIHVNFEDGYANLSKKAIEKILKFLRKGYIYSEACKEAGYNHSVVKCELRNKLPYYGEILREACLGAKGNPQNDIEKFGKISNVTVHIALNQVRLLINELIAKYGKPDDVAIEYARDLPASQEERNKIIKRQNENKGDNERIRKKVREIIGNEPSKDDINKYKIWESMNNSPLKRICPYTGKLISMTDLFSSNVEVDHILPFSRTFDDSLDNKIVCFASANRYKGNRTPYEAFGSESEWKEIYKRAKSLNNARSWRFEKGAMKRFNERNGTLIARLLNDTRYMTKILQQYLHPIVSEEGKKNIQAIPGMLTAMVRKAWGLNVYKDKKDKDKYRSEHYHHAIDAITVAAITRKQISDVVEAMKSSYSRFIDEINYEFKDELWKLDPENRDKVAEDEISNLRKRINLCINKKKEALVAGKVIRPQNINVENVQHIISNMNISHRPSLKNIYDKNSTVGALHEDSAYGFRQFPATKGLDIILHIKNLKEGKKVDFTTYVPIFEKKEDRDCYFDAYKKWFIAEGKSEAEAETKDEKKIKEELKMEEMKAEEDLREAAKKAFKWYVSGNNFCITIYEINSKHKVKGLAAKNRGEWESEVISNYNATIRSRRNENISYLTYKYPSSRKVMELRRNDMIVATFSRQEIESMKDDDRVEDENGKVKGSIIDGFAPGLRGYLKEKMMNHPGDCIDILFRLKKINVKGLMHFIPHDIAKELSADDMCWGIPCKKLKEHKARKVFVSVTGSILNA